MPILESIIPCQQIIQDNRTNMMSYINLLEGFKAKQAPITLPPVYVGTRWIRDTESDALGLKFKIRLLVQNPDKEIIIESEHSEIQMTTRWHRQNFIIQDIVFEKPGDYRFLIEINTGKKWEIRGETLVSFSLSGDD